MIQNVFDLDEYNPELVETVGPVLHGFQQKGILKITLKLRWIEKVVLTLLSWNMIESTKGTPTPSWWYNLGCKLQDMVAVEIAQVRKGKYSGIG